MQQRIAAAIRSHPTDSLRRIAAQVGSSPETVRKVRNAMMADPPCVAYKRANPLDPEHGGDDLDSRWTGDVALVSTDVGKAFSDWFERTCIDDDWQSHVDAPPLGRVYEIADEARRRAKGWADFAEAVEKRARER
jgi:hypothetical protein